MVGTNDLRKGGTYYKVEKLIAHSDYNRPQFANDIGLIQIKGEIEFNDRVKPIEWSTEAVSDGAKVQLTGWGRLWVSVFFLLIFISLFVVFLHAEIFFCPIDAFGG